MYGFQQECTQKYDRDVYEMFNTCFAQLSVAAIINQAVLVLHGNAMAEPPPHAPTTTCPHALLTTRHACRQAGSTIG